ncbi:hypothetical protein TRVL_02369 [Trypanosoma vivax]|uniref:Uncharacterized protein n=1 Tax=Trypanosoma vivax (strain Y486) TaxID=1055687 RepID=G0U913_TRYVY|nr:hypothetical protein TRVL_02369 [Trypanosoma vivax]CCC54096.1 hypothetical protein TVY486_1115800 [Trypanosoma vivax Y486]
MDPSVTVATSRVSHPSKISQTPNLADLSFDFLTSEEVVPLPVCAVERRIAEEQRGGNVNPDVTREEFAHMLGIDLQSFTNSAAGGQALKNHDALLSYSIDPCNSRLKKFQEDMCANVEAGSSMKCSTYLTETIQGDYESLKRFENDAIEMSIEEDMLALMELEDEQNREVFPMAHRMTLYDYRLAHGNKMLKQRLKFELYRRAAEANQSAVVTVSGSECDPDAPPQRQFKGKGYKNKFMWEYREKKSRLERERALASKESSETNEHC